MQQGHAIAVLNPNGIAGPKLKSRLALTAAEEQRIWNRQQAAARRGKLYAGVDQAFAERDGVWMGAGKLWVGDCVEHLHF